MGKDKRRKLKEEIQKKKEVLKQFFGRIKQLSDGTKYEVTPQGWRKIKEDVQTH